MPERSNGQSRMKILARFCPFCGSDKIDWDWFQNERKTFRHPNGRNDKVEYACQVCFRGFGIVRATREQEAIKLFAEERKVRQHRRASDGVAPETMQAWEQANAD